MADWNFFLTCERDEELVKGERKRLIRGIASTEREDKHKEEMLLAGMDFDPYLNGGVLNWDHMQGPQYILGVPVEAKIVPDGSKFKKGITGPAFYHLCSLHDSEPGRAAWDHMKAVENDPKRQLGFSVEGAVLATKGNKLTKTRVDDVALTRKPANTDSFAEFAKSLTAGDATALNLQYIDDNQEPSDHAQQALTGVSLDELLWGTCKHGCFDKKGKFKKGKQGAYLHLVKCHDRDEDEAFSFVKSLAVSGIV